MIEYLFVSQLPKEARRVFMGSVARALKLAAMYPDNAEHLYMRMPYERGDIALPEELSFYDIVRRR